MLQGRKAIRAMAGCGLERGKLASRPWAGLLPPRGLQNLFQGQNGWLGNNHTGFAVRLCIVPVSARVVLYRLWLNVQLIAKRGDARCGPTPKGHFTNSSDDLRGLSHIVITLAGLLIDIGLPCHRGKMPHGWRRVTLKVFVVFQSLNYRSAVMAWEF